MDPPDQTPFSRLQATLELQTEYAVHRHATHEGPLEEVITRCTEWPFYHDSFVATCPAAGNEQWMRCVRDTVASLPSAASPAEVFAHLRRSLWPGMRARIDEVMREPTGFDLPLDVTLLQPLIDFPSLREENIAYFSHFSVLLGCNR